MGRKLGAVPLWGGGAGSPSNTMWPGPRPTSMPGFILIRPTVWPQCTNVTDRQDRQTDKQRTDSIGRTVLQTVAQTVNQTINNCTELSVSARLHVTTNQSSSETFHVSLQSTSMSYIQSKILSDMTNKYIFIRYGRHGSCHLWINMWVAGKLCDPSQYSEQGVMLHSVM